MPILPFISGVPGCRRAALASAFLALPLFSLPGLGQAPEPARIAYAQRREPMTFTIAEGAGPQGAKRWVSANGQIQRDTATKFEAFRKANQINDLPLVIDSLGGSVAAGMLLGHMVRAARMPVTVARTITIGDSQVVRSTDVSCASSCVLVLMGGIRRYVPEDARVEVHMFSVSLNAEGDTVRPDVTMRDVEDAQRGMARHAIYLSDMGISARYLEYMSEASFKGVLRRLTPAEMTKISLAETIGKLATSGVADNWALTAAGSTPQMLRTLPLFKLEKQAADHELVITCDSVKGFYTIQYRQILTKTAPAEPSLSVTSARLETGGWDYVFRAPGTGLSTNKEGGDLWMRRSVPRKVLEDATSKRRLMVEISSRSGKYEPADFFEPSFAKALPQLAARCDARPGLVTVGPHPRR